MRKKDQINAIIKNHKDFLYSCPMCGTKHSPTSIKNFILSTDVYHVKIKNDIFNCLKIKSKFNNISIGIPCCKCFNKIFNQKINDSKDIDNKPMYSSNTDLHNLSIDIEDEILNNVQKIKNLDLKFNSELMIEDYTNDLESFLLKIVPLLKSLKNHHENLLKNIVYNLLGLIQIYAFKKNNKQLLKAFYNDFY